MDIQEDIEETGKNPSPSLELFVDMNQKLLDRELDIAIKSKIVLTLRKFSAVEVNPPNKLMISAGLLPTLLTDGLMTNEPDLVNVLWIITNIASGDQSDLGVLKECGGVHFLMKYSNHPSLDVVSQAFWGLSNIAGESAEYRDLLIGLGIVEKSIDFLNGPNPIGLSELRIVSWLYNNLCRFKPSVKLNKIVDILPYMGAMLNINDTEVNSNVLWAISHVSEISEAAMYKLLQMESSTMEALKLKSGKNQRKKGMETEGGSTTETKKDKISDKLVEEEGPNNIDEESNSEDDEDGEEEEEIVLNENSGLDLVQKLLQFLSHNELTCVTPAIRVLSNFATGDDVVCE